MSFPYKKFEITMPSDGGVSIGMIAASRSGKTCLMKYIIKKHFAKHITYFCTMNSHAEIYDNIGKNCIVANEYRPEILRDMHQMNSETKNKYNFLFVSDDYVDSKIKNDPEITRALTIYRNCGVSSIFSMQGRVLLSSVGRNQLNYILIGRQNTTAEYMNIVKEVLGGYLPNGLTMNEKVRFLIAAVQNHQFIMLDTINGLCYLTKLSKEQMGEIA